MVELWKSHVKSGRRPALAGDAGAQIEGGFDEAEQAERQHRPAEHEHRGIDAAEQEGAAAHALRDGVQHREAEHAVGHQQARRQHAGHDADEAADETKIAASGERRVSSAERSWPKVAARAASAGRKISRCARRATD